MEEKSDERSFDWGVGIELPSGRAKRRLRVCEVTAHYRNVVKSGSTTKRSLDFESRLESKAKFLETDRRRDLLLF